MRIQYALLSVAFSALSAVVAASPAKANCYENFGRTDSEYFAAHQLERAARSSGKCGISSSRSAAIASALAKAVKAFGNAGCLYHDVARVPRNDFERANISAVKGVESNKGC
jgi:hypothetical protein